MPKRSKKEREEAKIIAIQLRLDGFSYSKIANYFNVDTNTVYLWINSDAKKKSNERTKKWHTNNINYSKNWHIENNKLSRAISRKYYLKNREIKLQKNKEWITNNKNKHLLYRSKYNKVRCMTDPSYKIRKNLRSRLYGAIKDNYKTGSAVKDLGCSVEDLKKRLEILWLPGMSWENYGEWHIDHIIPLSSFDLTDRTQLLRACNFTNLQPLWAKDNLIKSNRK